MKVAVVSVSVFIPVYVNVHAALRGIDLRYVELARTLGLTQLEFVAASSFRAPCRASSSACGSPSRRAGRR